MENGNEIKTVTLNTLRRPLRIAQVGTPWLAIPPKKYGGTERVAYYVIEELVRRGHNVTLFGTADSNTSANLFTHPKFPTLEQHPGSVLWEVYFLWMFKQVRRHASEFDILHFHTNEHLGAIQGFENRTLTTMHYVMSIAKLPTLFGTFDKVPLVSISNDQRTHTTAKPRFVGTVYHGIPRDLLTFNPKPGAGTGQRPYLAFLGRLVEEKGPDWAIRISRESGIPLKLAGKVPNQTYWEETLKPNIDRHAGLIEYIGELDDTEKNHFLGNALALIFTSIGSEPFGLVMIESMACGTPVVGLKRGSVPEIVEPEITGLLFNTLAQGVMAVKRVGQLNRATVRKSFERRFSVEAMVDGYEQMYTNLMNEEEEARRELGRS